MKKNVLALSAVVAAIAFSSFTSAKFATVYFIYQGGTERDQSHYTVLTSASPVDGDVTLAWFKGTAANPNSVTSTEFINSFEAIDGDFGGMDDNLLSDESEDGLNIEKKN